ncbi:hypothetical protein N5K55_29115 [Pseudomonas aeruginosa]|nr:hypothetical protein [Pseudomonas aeruginosa]
MNTMPQQIQQKAKFEQDFLNRFGPLVSQKQLAELLGMSVRGSLRFSGEKMIWPKVFVSVELKLVGECFIAL